jgi:hypothetical protein
MTAIPEHVCLLTNPHEEHDWVYTSSGGGHMMDTWDDSGLERNQKWWHCPGVVEAEIVIEVEDPGETYVPTTDEVMAALDEAGIDTGPAYRWMRELQRSTWDQGYGTGVIDQTRWQDTGIPDGGVRNPYGEHRDGSTTG